MPTRKAPRAQAGKAPAFKGCFGAAVFSADRIDYWIRRHMIECAPGAAGDVPHELRSAAAQASALPPSAAGASARHHSSRVDRPHRPVLACDRRAWLSALGQSLKAEYDALAAPVPPHLAALVKQLEVQS